MWKAMRKAMKVSGDNMVEWLARVGAIAGLLTLIFAIVNMLLAQTRPSGQQSGAAAKILRTPYLVLATLLFLFLAYVFWKPLPMQLPEVVQLGLTLLGAILLFPSLGIYVWGLLTLGRNFNASSGFGVRLQQAHQLVTDGPFAYLRHPMYLAVILAGWGGLLMYRTWTMLGCAIMMLGLIYRGQAEEKSLAQAFGAEWEAYRRSVPGWILRWKPKIKERK
jgi:protein-S-isoprenylcysteine O-methyltransferase Ste14